MGTETSIQSKHAHRLQKIGLNYSKFLNIVRYITKCSIGCLKLIFYYVSTLKNYYQLKTGFLIKNSCLMLIYQSFTVVKVRSTLKNFFLKPKTMLFKDLLYILWYIALLPSWIISLVAFFSLELCFQGDCSSVMKKWGKSILFKLHFLRLKFSSVVLNLFFKVVNPSKIYSYT